MARLARRGALLLLLAVSRPELAACQPMDDAAKLARIEAMYAEYSRDFAAVPTVAAAELAALVERGAVLVDVRSAEEQAVSRLPGALTREEFEAAAGALAGRTVVTYCTIGARSGEYAAELRAAGWDARNLAGSLLAWTHAGGELVDPAGRPTRRLHVYGRRWDLAAAGYETTW